MGLTDFKYLGSTISADGDITPEVRARIKSAWLEWRQVTGVLCPVRPPYAHPTQGEDLPVGGATSCTVRLRVLAGSRQPRAGAACNGDALEPEPHPAGPRGQHRYQNQTKSGTDHLEDASNTRQMVRSLDAKRRTVGRPNRTQHRPCRPPTRGRPKKRWLDRLNEDMRIVNIEPDDAQPKTDPCEEEPSMRTLQRSGIDARTSEKHKLTPEYFKCQGKQMLKIISSLT